MDPYDGWPWRLKLWQLRFLELKDRWWSIWGLPTPVAPKPRKSNIVYLEEYRILKRKRDRSRKRARDLLG